MDTPWTIVGVAGGLVSCAVMMLWPQKRVVGYVLLLISSLIVGYAFKVYKNTSVPSAAPILQTEIKTESHNQGDGVNIGENKGTVYFNSPSIKNQSVIKPKTEKKVEEKVFLREVYNVKSNGQSGGITAGKIGTINMGQPRRLSSDNTNILDQFIEACLSKGINFSSVPGADSEVYALTLNYLKSKKAKIIGTSIDYYTESIFGVGLDTSTSPCQIIVGLKQ